MKIKKSQLLKLIKENFGEDIVSREFYTSKEFKGFKKISNVGNVHLKPKGLWYSCNDEWKEWVVWEMPQWWESYNFKYDIQVDLSTMLVIRSMPEILEFERKYVDQNSRLGPGFKAINWEAVANDYSGIEICPYQSEARYGTDWYYGWDIGSGCIWDPSAFVSVKEVYPFR
jgi:hypothetical protein